MGANTAYYHVVVAVPSSNQALLIMSKLYCPYTDRVISRSSASLEHVIPLSLGGVDEFTILVDSDANSKLGHLVDGALANDPIISMMRAKTGTRSQSGKAFRNVWKKTKGPDDQPLQIVIGKDSFEIFDPIQKKKLDDNETSGWTLNSTLKMDIYVRMPFAAKVGLGTGYFLFGDVFRKHCNHSQLRDALIPIDEMNKTTLRESKITYLDRLSDPNNDRMLNKHKIFEKLISFFCCSAVIVSIAENHLCFSVGLFGEWESTITVPANGNQFPYDNEFDQGHVILLQCGKLRILSFRRAVYELASQKLKMELPPFDEILSSVGLRSKD